MGCVTSTETLSSSSSCRPKNCFPKHFWICRSKKNYKVNPVPVLHNKETVSQTKSNLPVVTKTTETISVCDDFKEGYEDERSYGYFSESISTANTSSVSFNANDCDLKMEMYMMTKISSVMPKTSSPILPTKYSSSHSKPDSRTYDEENEHHDPQRSYNKWKRSLQGTPPYVLNNITRIPEAIAGQFSPQDFPGFTEVKQFQRGSIQSKPATDTYII